MLCKPGSITPHSKFEAEIYVLNKEEGGRHTPFFSNYRPQFFIRTADITGKVRCIRCIFRCTVSETVYLELELELELEL